MTFRMTKLPHLAGLLLAGLLLPGTSARAEMVLSQVIVDMTPDKPRHDDIEVWNDGPERMYVLAEPAQILAPGTSAERRVTNPDPAVTGLLVTPQRMVLEPGQRRIVRVASLLPRDASERIYRVTIKPVAGPVSAASSALKVLVGYDVLVLVRPTRITGEVTGQRAGRRLTLRNQSNTAQELYDGRQCNAAGRDCRDLPARRLYAGSEMTVDLPYDTRVGYRLMVAGASSERQF